MAIVRNGTYRMVRGAMKHQINHLFLQPSRRVPPIVTEMPRLSCPQQWPPKKAQRAGAPASATPRPGMPFCFSTPHFGVPHLNAACIAGGKSAMYVSSLLLHVCHYLQCASAAIICINALCHVHNIHLHIAFDHSHSVLCARSNERNDPQLTCEHYMPMLFSGYP